MRLKIGVLGSCVTRDVFNSQFIPKYKDFFEVKISAPRISMISMMQAPLNVDKNALKIILAIIVIVLCVLCYEFLNNDNVVEIAYYL